MSEIEIVSDPKPQQNPHLNGLIMDVYSASAYGDLQKLKHFVENEGQSVSTPDASGYYALQWAALNNYAEIAQYLIEHGADVNSVDNLQQSALHWAAVKGAIAAADVILQNGARVEASDLNGYRAVHVAAQYGQTTFLYHLIVKHGADFDAPDNDGRSPLHWAAYKGYVDTVRLLLFKDANQGGQDKDGCTPLHWAALRGNAEVCTLLVHAGTKQELAVNDKSGFTPALLAADKGHRHAAHILSNAAKTRDIFCKNKLLLLKMGTNGFAPILFFIIIILMIIFINSVLAAPNFPKVTAVVGLWSCITLSLASGSMYMLYRCSSKDPGYIMPNSEASMTHVGDDDPLLNLGIENSTVWTGSWSLLCPTCKIIRPMRSKHCTSCKRCVEQFDHHCPWISNCVGKRNKWDFFMLICMATATAFLAAAITVHRMLTVSPVSSASDTLHMISEHPGAVLFIIVDTIILIGVLVLTVVQASQMARNITTNEQSNAARYSYLQGPDGRFRNPYNRGIRKNCTYFFIHGYGNDDEIAWPSLQQAAS